MYFLICCSLSLCFEHAVHVMPLWNKLQDRKRKLGHGAQIGGTATFKKVYTTLGQLIKEEPEWVITFLVAHTNCNIADFIKIKEHDKDGLTKLVDYPLVHTNPNQVPFSSVWICCHSEYKVYINDC